MLAVLAILTYASTLRLLRAGSLETDSDVNAYGMYALLPASLTASINQKHQARTAALSAFIILTR
ncbi:hypothetical protein EGJ48_12980 [Pantoea dispersa]|nr:hypothetical protein EGJ48_12980 [Pantoea dispersa]